MVSGLVMFWARLDGSSFWQMGSKETRESEANYGWSRVLKLRDLASPGPAVQGGFGLRVEDPGVCSDIGC